MEFFCYHRDRAGSAELRDRLVETHWTYMDGYAEELIARGPTLDDADDDVATGSVPVVAVADAAAARAFAFDEPTFQAGVYRDVLLRRWRNDLGRTMWDFPGIREERARFLVIGLGPAEDAELAQPADDRDLIAFGPLLSDDGSLWLGTAALVQAPDAAAAAAVLADTDYAGREVHRWQPGGRPES